MFATLLAQPGVLEELAVRSRFGFLAFHGGSLERRTDTIAREAARRSGSSYYGVVMPPEFRWHLPGRCVDPAQSERLAEFVTHVDVAVAVHGYGRGGLFTTLLLGGRNRVLAAHLAAPLRGSLGHYDVVDDLDAIPADLRGLHEENPVNRCAGRGVQLELPPRIRGMGPYWTGSLAPSVNPHTEALVTALVTAALSWPDCHSTPAN